MSRRLTPTEEKFIRDNHLLMPLKDIAAHLGRQRSTIREFKKREGIVTPKEVTNQFKTLFQSGQVHRNKTNHHWQKWEEDIVRKKYATTLTKEIATELNMTEKQVSGKARLLGLKKDPEHLKKVNARRYEQNKQILAKYQFKPNQSSPFKGKKAKEAYSEKGYQNFLNRKQSMVKGEKPYNTRPVGDIRISDKGIHYIKIADEPFQDHKNWKLLSHHIYEQHYGELPPNTCITHRDNDKSNHDITNLELVKLTDLPKRNKLHDYPPEIKHLIRLRARLTRKINTLNKKKNA